MAWHDMLFAKDYQSVRDEEEMEDRKLLMNKCGASSKNRGKTESRPTTNDQ